MSPKPDLADTFCEFILKRNISTSLLQKKSNTFCLSKLGNVQNHMRGVCCVASNYADAVHKKDFKRILVILNPVANKHKCEGDFQKYCEPILHLAGFTVDTIKTSYVGHAKSYFENIDFTPDAIVVAGGDGTASEVITGIMRREKSSCPIAFIPMGRRSYSQFQYNKLAYVTSLTNSVLLLLNGTASFERVIKFECLENENGINKINKPIFGINSFKWGVLRDLDAIQNKYWYFGIFKKHAAIVFNAFSDKLTWDCTADVTYTPPCNGCENCCKNIESPKNSWLKYLYTNESKKHKESDIINDECKKTIQCSVSTSQITTTSLCKEDMCQLVTKSYTKIDSGVDFIKRFFNANGLENFPCKTISSRTIQVIPTVSYENKFFSIDGEEYEVRPIRISLILKAIEVFS